MIPPAVRRATRVAALAAACAVPAAAAGPPHHAGLGTATLLFPPPGELIASVGVEHLPRFTHEVAGARGALLRLPTVGLRLGLSEAAEFRIDWPAYNRLRVDEQQDPPPLGRRLGATSTDWGDRTVATHIQLRPPGGGWPGGGLRFAARLPNSNETLAIGDNTTDVFAAALLAQPLGRLTLHADLGVGILSERTASFRQNDVLTYGVLADWRAGPRARLLAEAHGRVSTHRAGPGTGTRGELRAGVELAPGPVHATALLIHGIAGPDRAGLGVAFALSTRFTVLRRAGGRA